MINQRTCIYLLLCGALFLSKLAQASDIDGRYRDNGNGTITDSKTNLTWMRCSLGQQWTGSTYAGVAMEMNWNDALRTEMSFSYAGHSDWRVPTVDELDTLVQCSAGREPSVRPNGEFVADTSGGCLGDKHQRPTINITVFHNTPDNWYWSSSPYAYNSDHAWHVSIYSGYVFYGYKYSNHHVRLVRAGQ
ncbi:TPA: DUF1566 domain-containing protein [Vibrio cholerae]|nr:DUF1566 domain-containing protein [Vibrio cholerae]